MLASRFRSPACHCLASGDRWKLNGTYPLNALVVVDMTEALGSGFCRNSLLHRALSHLLIRLGLNAEDFLLTPFSQHRSARLLPLYYGRQRQLP